MRLLFPKKIFFFLLCFSGIWTMAQFKVPEKPNTIYPVFDKAKLLDTSQEMRLNQKLIAFHDSTSVEIAIVVLPTTNGEDINFAAAQLGNEWKIGKKGKDNGIVLLIATEDRKIAIQQGRDVEKYLTASVAGQIIDYLITPQFKKGNYYQGLNVGTDALMEAVQGKYKPDKKSDTNDNESVIAILIIIMLIVVVSYLKANDDDDFTLSRSGKRRYGGGFFPFPGSFGGGSSRSGGGFGGFGGGGSFGGGGASGGW